MSVTEWIGDPGLTALLQHGELEVEGRLGDASNTTLRCRIASPDGRTVRCVVKPVSGERPLWDFPEWTLTRRELAAHALSVVIGWDLVPPTVWREDGPGGEGMCQLWIDELPQERQVGVVRPHEVPDGWRCVLEAEDGRGRPVLLVHSDASALARLAAFDVIVNNADRKGGHVLTGPGGRIWAIDHGVTFSTDDKLRTVLWGWAGEPVADEILTDLDGLAGTLATTCDPVDRWLAFDEREALRERLAQLLRTGTYPEPSGHWPAIPWPVF